MKWKLSAFADEASDSLDGQIQALQEAGLDLIDLRNVDGVNIAALPLDHARRSQDKLQAAAIGVGMYGSPIGKLDIAEDFAIDLERLRHLAELKGIFGCPNVHFELNTHTDRPSDALLRDPDFHIWHDDLHVVVEAKVSPKRGEPPFLSMIFPLRTKDRS